MPRLAANLSMMFNEVGFLDRFEAAAKAGFTGVEFLFPYEFKAEEIRKRLDDNGLTQVLFNAPPGDWNGGERGLACLPNRKQEFRDGFMKALDYAGALGNRIVHVMAGIPKDIHPITAAATYATNLAWASRHATAQGVKVVIEPINHRDMPGYHLATQEQGAAIIEALGFERVGLQFDVYHCQVAQGDIVKRMGKLIKVISHMQIADVPARNEPGTGEINWSYVFSQMDALGYQGWVGCEYRPAGETVAGLGWRKTYGV